MRLLEGRMFFAWTAAILVAVLAACSTPTSGEAVDIESGESTPDHPSYSSSVQSSSSDGNGSGESRPEDHKGGLEKLSSLIQFVDVPKSELNRDKTVMSVSPFKISKTEVTQSLYKKVMGVLPAVQKMEDNIAVANVSWFDAVLFCNALSKQVGLDTAYVYEEIGLSNYLKNVTINYGVQAVRLPTETEWEIACRGGTTTTYYWGVAEASRYAYYAQTSNKGPAEVGQYLPNAFGLYDMSGNVAEWTNDWYGAYPVRSTENYRGPEDGERRVIRGGGWSDKASALASANREKNVPSYQSEMVGFRISVTR